MKCVISFGTDGWRSTMDTDFTVKNLEIAAQGIANYLHKSNFNEKGIIIGYDTRKNSQKFAEEVAKVLVGNNLKVFLTGKDTPIPVVTYSISDRNLDGGIMITASHNPPEYNGIKFIPYYASPALPDITNPIMDEIRKTWDNPKIKRGDLKAAAKSKQFRYVDLKERYKMHVRKLLDQNSIRRAKLKVIFDALYGTARNYMPSLLREMKVEAEFRNTELDPTFGGKSPNPSKETLQLVSQEVVKKGFDLGLSCDGDADRLGVIDDKGEFIHANILFALLLEYELARGKTGDVVRTVGTTHLIDRIAIYHNLKTYETPVGAKYIGQYMREKNLLMGGEESGGMIFRGHIAEKDGIYANLKIIEMLAYYQKPLSEITEDLFKKYGQVYFTLINFPCKDENKEKAMSNIVNVLPATVAGSKVVKTTKIDGFKFILEDDSWLLIRPSGTEPVLRLYGEANTKQQLTVILEEGKSFLEKAQT
ncbi:MAG: phosphoglucomutase/phosphomannomutase family protein [Candidatus Helarchaeota archaeon]